MKVADLQNANLASDCVPNDLRQKKIDGEIKIASMNRIYRSNLECYSKYIIIQHLPAYVAVVSATCFQAILLNDLSLHVDLSEP